MAADNRTIKELSASGLDNAAPLCIQYPAAAQGKTEEFELKSSLLHHIPKYHGLSMEDPNKHLKEFEVVCSSMTPINVDGSILKMKAFPFSLLEKAKDWLYELAPGTVTSWESMKRAFLEKFFPTSRVILLRKMISGIQQEEGESFPTYYERFKSLVASYPQHQMKEELLLQYFYEGLLPIERQMLDASAGGALVDKTPTAAKTLISNRALNAQQYEGVGQRSNPRQHQVNEVVEGPKVQNVAVCGVCSTHGHLTDKCPQLIEMEGGKPSMPWDLATNTNRGMTPFLILTIPVGEIIRISNGENPNKPNNKLHLGNNPRVSIKSHWHPHNLKHNLPKPIQGMQNKDKMMDELEKQVGQIAEFMGQFREQGKLPSSTVVNPRGGVETAKAITLRSGKEVGTEPKPSKSAPKEDEKLQIEEMDQAKATTRVEQSLPQPPKPSNSATIGKEGLIQVNSNVIPPNVPFPSRFLRAKKEEEKDVLETFRKVHVNIPLLDAIKQIPKYAKFLKKLCTTRKRIREKEVVHVDHLIFPADFYVLDMEDSTHSPPSPLLLGRPFMKTAQTKINMAKGAVTMAFGGDMINFKISESVENTNDVRSCCAINVVEKPLHAVGFHKPSMEHHPAARRFMGKVCKRMHFGAFWSKMELGMNVTYLEPKLSLLCEYEELNPPWLGGIRNHFSSDLAIPPNPRSRTIPTYIQLIKRGTY
ncbi:unnamed protein product [Malus baccata var. baccata]